MSPRASTDLPAELAEQLRQAVVDRAAAYQAADDRFRQLVIKALQHGSVRQVAAAAGLSPTTVHAWSQGRERS